MVLSLSDLLRPIVPEVFLRDIWDRAPWFGRKRVAPAEAHALLNLRSLEQIIASLHRPGDGWLQLARGGRRALPDHMLGEDGLIQLRALYAAFAQGDTLYLTKAERLAPPLMHLCRAIELELAELGVRLRQAVNAHVFLTPPSSQGFPAHRDEHASVVVQLEGAKHWRIYDRTTEPVELRDRPPQPGAVDREALGAKVRTYALEAGDVLYIPEGWAHEAEADVAHSLHVTFRIFALRWSDVLRALAPRDGALAVAVPRHGLDDAPALARQLGDLLASEAWRARLVGHVSQLAAEQVVPARVLPDDGLRQVLRVGAIALDSVLTHRAGATCAVFVDGNDRACIAFPGGIVRGPAVLVDVFRHVAATPRLRPRDLPSLPAPDLRYDRLDIARTLVRDGLLRIELAEHEDEDDATAEPGDASWARTRAGEEVA